MVKNYCPERRELMEGVSAVVQAGTICAKGVPPWWGDGLVHAWYCVKKLRKKEVTTGVCLR